ncbi:MAG TPA: hypothetical protein VGF23_14370 [Gaiellaceae bacterium]
MSIAPDYAEPISGWRAWLVAEREGDVRLRSLFFPAFWPARHELVAECLCRRLLPLPKRFRASRHTAPARRCECGVYATDLRNAVEYFKHARSFQEDLVVRVLGRVSLWGSVVECERGWRAARAYPSALFLPSRSLGGRPLERLERIAFGLADYGVPVHIVDAGKPDELMARLAASGPPLAA